MIEIYDPDCPKPTIINVIGNDRRGMLSVQKLDGTFAWTADQIVIPSGESEIENWDPDSRRTTLLVTSENSGGATIHGLIPDNDAGHGQQRILVNIGNEPLTFPAESTTASARNRFLEAFELPAGSAALLYRTKDRWAVIGGSSESGETEITTVAKENLPVASSTLAPDDELFAQLEENTWYAFHGVFWFTTADGEEPARGGVQWDLDGDGDTGDTKANLTSHSHTVDEINATGTAGRDTKNVRATSKTTGYSNANLGVTVGYEIKGHIQVAESGAGPFGLRFAAAQGDEEPSNEVVRLAGSWLTFKKHNRD